MYSAGGTNKPWLCQTQTCKLQLSHSVHYGRFHFQLVITHKHTHTHKWAMLWSSEPQLNILVPDLRFALLPWQHNCCSVMSIMGWGWGESGVKPHVCLCVCVRWRLTLVTIRCHCLCVCVCIVIHCCISYVFFCMCVCDTLQITGLLWAGCKAQWLVTV